MNAILLIAHAPLANALRQCALHVFPDCGSLVVAIDVQPNLSPDETLGSARIALDQLARSPQVKGVLVLTDIFGATPSNVAQKLVDGVNAKSIMGVMMLAAGVGTEITVETDGEREQEAMDALLALINDKFGEGE